MDGSEKRKDLLFNKMCLDLAFSARINSFGHIYPLIYKIKAWNFKGEIIIINWNIMLDPPVQLHQIYTS